MENEIATLPTPEDSCRFEVGQVFMVTFVNRHKGTIGLNVDLKAFGWKLVRINPDADPSFPYREGE